MKDSNIKSYTLWLPVFKQGDDLATHLEDNKGHPVKSFLDLAERYIDTASICRMVAETLSSEKYFSNIHIEAGTHCIRIDAPEETVKKLVDEEILEEEEIFEEEEDSDDLC